MGLSAAQQPDAPALPLRQVVLDHAQLAVALDVERLQPDFAAGVQLLLDQTKSAWKLTIDRGGESLERSRKGQEIENLWNR